MDETAPSVVTRCLYYPDDEYREVSHLHPKDNHSVHPGLKEHIKGILLYSSLHHFVEVTAKSPRFHYTACLLFPDLKKCKNFDAVCNYTALSASFSLMIKNKGSVF